MKILITGSTEITGSVLTPRLLEREDKVIAIDNHNDSYNPALKKARLARHDGHQNSTHIRGDLADFLLIEELFKMHESNCVINLDLQTNNR